VVESESNSVNHAFILNVYEGAPRSRIGTQRYRRVRLFPEIVYRANLRFVGVIL
jgi:hypothetical protein